MSSKSFPANLTEVKLIIYIIAKKVNTSKLLYLGPN